MYILNFVQSGLKTVLKIFIEPLAAAIRLNNTVKGIQNDNSEHKLFFYYLLLHLQNPSTCNPVKN